MKVKNILINEKNEFIELLIRKLIKYEIGYVHIDNEIHFDNYIFRFYDIQDDKEEIRRIIDEDVLKIEIIKVNDGYQMTTKKGAYECLVQLFDNRAKPSLSSAALEILSIIAYNPKITRAEIEAIRGVNSDGTLYRLLEYHLVEEAGKMDAPGRPTMYRTTDEFLKMFGISSLDELPELPRYRLDENEQIVLEEMSDVATNKSSEN